MRARLGFGEEHMLLGHGVVLAEFELGGELTGVLGLEVEASRAGSGDKAHQDGIRPSPSPSPWRPPQLRPLATAFGCKNRSVAGIVVTTSPEQELQRIVLPDLHLQ